MNLSLMLFATLAAAQPRVSGTVTLPGGAPGKLAAVWLEGGTRSKPLKHVVIDQRDRRFVPHVTIVTVGTTVSFPNSDTVFHNVFTEYHSERFDLGMYARGRTKTQKFDRTGLAVLLCSIHSEMSAYVMCVDTPYYVLADAHGEFELPAAPPGRYTLHVWHESGATLTRSITLPYRGELKLEPTR